MQESKEQLLKLRCEMFPLQIYKKNLAYFDSVDNFNCDVIIIKFLKIINYLVE